MVCDVEEKVSPKAGQMKIAVIGLGRFGESLASALAKRGCYVLGIDRDAALVQRLSAQFSCTALDATDKDALREVEINSFDAAVVAIGTNFESNLMTTVALQELGVRHIVCQSKIEYERELLLRVGADRVIEPESQAGRWLATELAATDSRKREQLALGQDHRVAKLQAPVAATGHSLLHLDLDRLGVNVLTIHRGDELLVQPPADTVLREGDLLVVVGSKEALASLSDSF